MPDWPGTRRVTFHAWRSRSGALPANNRPPPQGLELRLSRPLWGPRSAPSLALALDGPSRASESIGDLPGDPGGQVLGPRLPCPGHGRPALPASEADI